MKKFLGLLLAFTLSLSIAQAQIPISNLPNGGTMRSTDSVPATRSGVTLKVNPPVIGSIASQNSNSIQVTGGTIDNTVIGGNTPNAGSFSPLNLVGQNPGLLFLDVGSIVQSDIGFFYIPNNLLQMIHDNAGAEDAWTVACNTGSGCNELLRDDNGFGTAVTLDTTTGGSSLFNFLTSTNGGAGVSGINMFTDSGSFGSGNLATGQEVGHIYFGGQRNGGVDFAKIIVTAEATQSSTSSPGKACIYTTANGSKVLSATAAWCVDQANNFNIGGHLHTVQITAPSIVTNDCGSTSQGAITAGSTDNSGKVTVGTAAVTSCKITFHTAYTVAPQSCILQPDNTTAAAVGTTGAYISSITTTDFTITGLALDSAAYFYHCF